MEVIGKLFKFVKDPIYRFEKLSSMGVLRYMSDEEWTRKYWKFLTGKELNLDNPVGFNEKLQWLKLYDRNPEYVKLVDKYKVREFVKEKVGEQYLIPLLGVWDNVDDIDVCSLPKEFVIKCNHTSGDGIYICRDKNSLNWEWLKKKIKKSMQKDYSRNCREWLYKDVERKIVVEQLMKDVDPTNISGSLIDYKFYCFNGEPKFLYVGIDDTSSGEKGELRLSFLDLDWNEPPFYRGDHRAIPYKICKPSGFDKMIDIARILSKNIPFVRVDLYWINNNIYFSELTFYPGGGHGFFSPEVWENKLGEYIQLPTIRNVNL